MFKDITVVAMYGGKRYNDLPVLPVVAVILKLLIASSPRCHKVAPFAEVEIVELVLPDKLFC
jgi:hypothetical protein